MSSNIIGDGDLIYLRLIQNTYESVCIVFNEKYSKNWGFSVQVGNSSLKRCAFFLEDVLKANPAFPETPGPFKVAAAFLMSSLHFVEFSYVPLQGGDILSAQDRKFWKTRLLFMALPALLLQLRLTSSQSPLKKVWNAPSNHYRLEFLNLLRWCEFPFNGPSDPPPPNKPTVDMVRSNRLILALTLIIEACYYLSGNVLKCDVINQGSLHTSKMEDFIVADLIFDKN